ncbi:unnamed protein product [Peniophora sp. CBMAI 1063]|nr:unnamed protein product [Peniophora sp. CBMAI 1063]
MSASAALSLLHQLTSLQDLTVVFGGIYLHEFSANLSFDWRLVTRIHTRSTLASVAKSVYLACRILMLIYSVCVVVITFPGHPRCHALLKLFTVTGWFSVLCSSLLMSIRVGAVWQWDKRVTIGLTLVWLATFASTIYSMSEIDSSYEAPILSCAFTGVHRGLIPAATLIISDCTILTLLLLGLQKRWKNARQYYTWNLLWTQGLLYLLLAMVLELPTILLAMDIDSIMNTMMVTPAAIILTIAASRMYRSLHALAQGDSTASDHFTNGTTHDAHFVARQIELQDMHKT